MSNKKIP